MEIGGEKAQREKALTTCIEYIFLLVSHYLLLLTVCDYVNVKPV